MAEVGRAAGAGDGSTEVGRAAGAGDGSAAAGRAVGGASVGGAGVEVASFRTSAPAWGASVFEG